MSATAFDNNLLGWHRDDAAVEAFCQALDDRGTPAVFSAAQPELTGYWRHLVSRGVTGVYLQDAEERLFGRHLPAENQARGTCTSRGTFRACQDAWYWSLSQRGEIGRPVRLAFEPIYAGSRVQIGRGRLGRGDGSVGAWAAQFVHDYGLLERGRYGSIDLTEPREDLSVEWGLPGAGVPAELLNASRSHLVGACHFCPTVEAIADAVAAGFAVAYCSNLLWSDRDANGMARPDATGGHCEEVCGVFTGLHGDLCFVRQQSWGARSNGPDSLRYAGGTKKLRQGSYGAYADDLARGLRGGGEAWSFGAIHGWRPDAVADVLN